MLTGAWRMLKKSRSAAIADAAILFILVAAIAPESMASPIIAGTEKNCTNDGERVYIKGVTDISPCIHCYCRDHVVQCFPESCKTPEFCFNLFERDELCCPQCQECRVDGQVLQTSSAFHSKTDCGIINCNNGIVTRSERKCHAVCSGPLPPPTGECCPYCPGCTFDGIEYTDGEEFMIPGLACVECICKAGRLHCSRRVCPVLPCDEENRRMSTDGCCSECVGSRRVFELDRGQCWFQRTILRDRESVTIDRCTECACANGTVVCERTSCPVQMDCRRSEQIHLASSCCPVCERDLLRNCTDTFDSGQPPRKHGEEWTDESDPCLSCRCNNGTATCTRLHCQRHKPKCMKGESLEKTPGTCCAKCNPEPGVCSVFGDPHYRTYDGRPFSFQGDCSYVLSRDCLGRNFSLVVRNDAKRSRAFAWTSSVYLRLFAADRFNETIISLHQHLVVRMNGRRVRLPLVTNHVWIRARRGLVDVRTARGISLSWDGDSYLDVAASQQYRGALCGMCGNFNGFARDDFIGGDGLFKMSADHFGRSWIAADGARCSRPDYSKKLKEPCDQSLETKLRARRQCSLFKSPSFRPCYNAVDPSEYYKSCLTDTCQCYRERTCACESIKAYVTSCARVGVKIAWDKNLYCKKTCQKGKVFSSCGQACVFNCRNYKNARRTKRCRRRRCVAGCHCPAGHVLQRGRCVKPSTCVMRRPHQHDKSPRNKLDVDDNPFVTLLNRGGG